MRRKIKKKSWRDNRSKKFLIKRTKENKNRRKRRFGKNVVFQAPINEVENIFTVPKKFSIVNNTEETIKFFNDLCRQINQKKLYKRFYIDSEHVEEVTIDALVYIIAIIHNIRIIRSLKYQFRGNMPNSSEASRIYKESGFLNYFNTKIPKELTNNENKIQITSGTHADTELSRQICNFVIEKFQTTKMHTKVLYTILIELMANVKHHAYVEKKSEGMKPHWYLFAEFSGERIKFTFVDTGEGIPSTVKKKFFEKIGIGINDSELMLSAFRGEGRTETGLDHRGHGLPSLYENIKASRITNFSVVSGKGKCYSSQIGKNEVCMKTEVHRESIFGTIFRFDIMKVNYKGDEYEDNKNSY